MKFLEAKMNENKIRFFAEEDCKIFEITKEMQKNQTVIKIDEEKGRSICVTKKTIQFISPLVSVIYPHNFQFFDRSDVLFIYSKNISLLLSKFGFYHIYNFIFDACFDVYAFISFAGYHCHTTKCKFMSYPFCNNTDIYYTTGAFNKLMIFCIDRLKNKNSVFTMSADNYIYTEIENFSTNYYTRQDIIHKFKDDVYYKFVRDSSGFKDLISNQFFTKFQFDDIIGLNNFHKKFETSTEMLLSYFSDGREEMLKIKRD